MELISKNFYLMLSSFRVYLKDWEIQKNIYERAEKHMLVTK